MRSKIFVVSSLVLIGLIAFAAGYSTGQESSARKWQPFDHCNMFSTGRAADCNSVRGLTAAPRARETGRFGTVHPPCWLRVAKLPPLRLHLTAARLELPGCN